MCHRKMEIFFFGSWSLGLDMKNKKNVCEEFMNRCVETVKDYWCGEKKLCQIFFSWFKIWIQTWLAKEILKILHSHFQSCSQKSSKNNGYSDMLNSKPNQKFLNSYKNLNQINKQKNGSENTVPLFPLRFKTHTDDFSLKS